jgi:hypothetical protein
MLGLGIEFPAIDCWQVFIETALKLDLSKPVWRHSRRKGNPSLLLD